MKEASEKYFNELITVLQKTAKNKELLKAFLEDLLTPAEIPEVSTRWQIAKALSAGETHRSIANRLDVGVVTVSRGVNMLQKPKGGFNRMLDKI